MYLEKKERKMKILKKTTKKICCLKKNITFATAFREMHLYR